MKNLIIKTFVIFAAMVGLLMMSNREVHAYSYSADGQGVNWAMITSGTDMQAAIAANEPNVKFTQNIYINNSNATNYTIKKPMNIDFNNYAVFANDHSLAFFTVTGAGSNIYVKNMNMQSTASTDVKVACPTENGSSLTSNTGYSRGYYAVFYGTNTTTATLTYENCTWSFPNVTTYTQAFWWQGGHIILKGNNTITQLGDQELAEAYAIEVQPGSDPNNPGVTTIQENNKNDYFGSIDTGVDSNAANASTDPMLLRVAQGATLNWSSMRGGNFWYGNGTMPLLWDIQGTFNYNNTSTTSYPIFENTTGLFTLNIGPQGIFNFKSTGPLFQFDLLGTVTMTAANGANIDIENNNGAGILSGTPNTNDTVTLGQVASAKFASKTAPVFGSNVAFKITTTSSMRTVSYSDQAATNPNLYKRGVGPMTMTGGYTAAWAGTTGTYLSSDMSTLQKDLAHTIAYPKGLNYMDVVYGTNTWPTDFNWATSMQNLPAGGTNTSMPRNSGNKMMLGIYDDRDVPGWTLSVAASPLVNDGVTIPNNAGQTLNNALVWTQGSTTIPLSDNQSTAVMNSNNSGLTVAKASDYTITLAENAGLQAVLNKGNTLSGDYSGTVTWTLSDGVS